MFYSVCSGPGHLAFALTALVFASCLATSSSSSNFSRSFNKLHDDQIVSFLDANPSLSVQLSDLHFTRYLHENERLVQGLIVPMLFDQRVTLLVSRFHSSVSSHAIDAFLDKFIDTIDATPNLNFLVEFIVAPSYPLYRTFQQFESQSSVDETLQFMFIALSLIEVLRLVAFVLNLYVSRQTSGASFLGWMSDQLDSVFSFVIVGLFALFSYFVLWNPLIYPYLGHAFTAIASLLFGFMVHRATSNLGLTFLLALLPVPFMYSAISSLHFQIPLKIVSNVVLLALPFWLFRRKDFGDDKLVPFDDLDFSKSVVVGKGGCGTVVIARYFSAKVAVKFINQGEHGTMPDPSTVKNLVQEVFTQQSLQHPSVVRIFGVVEAGENGSKCMNFPSNSSVCADYQGENVYFPAVIMELCKSHDLQQYISRTPNIPWIWRVQTSKKIAQGVAYLHGKGIVHSDLKPGNLLFNESGTIQIADFGMALRGLKQGQWKGYTQMYAAPEYSSESRIIDKKVDVYAFGMIMFCIYSGDPDGPFNPKYWNSVEEYNTTGKLGARPSFPSHPRAFIAAASTLPADSETKFCAIMRECWSQDPSDRPDMRDVASRLEQLCPDD